MVNKKDGWLEVPFPKDDESYQRSLDWVAERMNKEKMRNSEMVAFNLVVDAIQEYESKNFS